MQETPPPQVHWKNWFAAQSRRCGWCMLRDIYYRFHALTFCLISPVSFFCHWFCLTISILMSADLRLSISPGTTALSDYFDTMTSLPISLPKGWKAYHMPMEHAFCMMDPVVRIFFVSLWIASYSLQHSLMVPLSLQKHRRSVKRPLGRSKDCRISSSQSKSTQPRKLDLATKSIFSEKWWLRKQSR